MVFLSLTKTVAHTSPEALRNLFSSREAQQANLQIKNVLKYAPYHLTVKRDSHETSRQLHFLHTHDAKAPRANTLGQSIRRDKPHFENGFRCLST